MKNINSILFSFCLLLAGCSASSVSSVQSVTSSSSTSSSQDIEVNTDILVEKNEDITWNGVTGHFITLSIEADMTLDSGITELDENAEILKECNNIQVQYLTGSENSGYMVIMFLNDKEFVGSWSGKIRKGEISDDGTYKYNGNIDEETAHSEMNSIINTVFTILNEHLEYKDR